MIAKKYRLTEREVKKVLRKWKPFFSYTLVINVFPNRLGYNRFALVIGKKTVPNNVIRNTYRRLFYDFCASYLQQSSSDIVCVIKSRARLHKSPESQKKFSWELFYLFDTKLWKNT